MPRPPIIAGPAPASAPGAPVDTHQAAHHKRNEPTLLSDFLLGRPSPARVAAQRTAQRRKTIGMDAAGVRKELQQEMRAAQLRKQKQPGGVHARVKAWQKASVTAMKEQGGGIPHAEDVASEPTEVAVQVEVDSVTEEDRKRIQMRKKPKPRRQEVKVTYGSGQNENAHDDDDDDDYHEPGEVEVSSDLITKAPPKKRVVSDEHWMKRRQGKSPPRAKTKSAGSPLPIPKDFLQRTTQNPSVQNKIKDWAMRVEVPEKPGKSRVKTYHYKHARETVVVEEEPSTVVSSDDGIRVRPTPESKDEGGVRIARSPETKAAPKPTSRPWRQPIPKATAKAPPSPSKEISEPGDGIMHRPNSSKTFPDDGIRVRPMDLMAHDDGIRVTACDMAEGEKVTEPRASVRKKATEESGDMLNVKREKSATKAQMAKDTGPKTDTLTKGQATRLASRRDERATKGKRSRSRSATRLDAEAETVDGSDASYGTRFPEGSGLAPTVWGDKSLTEIPFGFSAFSDLELPLRGQSQSTPPITARKPKTQGSPGFKAVPKVLKKVVTGAKEMMQETAVPRPGVNQPPNIETWLKNTVDPFVEDQPARKSDEKKKWADETCKRPSPDPRADKVFQPVKSDPPEGLLGGEKQDGYLDEELPKSHEMAKVVTPPSGGGLKRSRATRSPASPLAKSSGRKPFRKMLKEAFRGESAGHKLPPMVYPSCEASGCDSSILDDETEASVAQGARDYSPLSGQRRWPSPDPPSTVSSSQDSLLSKNEPVWRKAPAGGFRPLSTILSEEASSVCQTTETGLTLSQATVTQITGPTRRTDSSRQKSQNSQKSGLKRRLTKHSDLVSILSLPDAGHRLASPARCKSIQWGKRDLHRRPSKLDQEGIGELLLEFSDDEHFYQRELKTLVDGVVPVLLNQVVHGDTRSTTDLFEHIGAADNKSDNMGQAVVRMGLALEKLRNWHKRVPLHDMHGLLVWLDGVHDMYDQYVNAWRLGFQDLIVNLAPVGGHDDDDDMDSLLHALPRNENGDVLGYNGERVDVAHLLKRPLIRIKWITKFLKAAAATLDTAEVQDGWTRWKKLHDKVRKRHREETARMTDEDANNTDTTRARDLRTLNLLDNVMIDQTRTVAAKDSFSLDLQHSSGQRLECHTELIHRDRPDKPSDKGDILIRDITGGTEARLLFPPVPWDKISAVMAEGEKALLVMIRGTHNYREWRELFYLRSTERESLEFWLETLGRDPKPCRAMAQTDGSRRNSMPSPKAADDADVPVGERKFGHVQLTNPELPGPGRPARYRDGNNKIGSTAWPGRCQDSPSRERMPAEESHGGSRTCLQPRPLPDTPTRGSSSSGRREDKARPNSTPFREDGAPPPPVHRTLSLGPQESPIQLSPLVVDLGPRSLVKRRNSSPLKHEYHPSDASSESEGSGSTTDGDGSSVSGESDSSSQDDDLSSDEDVPDTIPGISVKYQGADDEECAEEEGAGEENFVHDRTERPALAGPDAVESCVSEGSVLPEQSASQVGLPQVQRGTDQDQQREVKHFVAKLSYWTDIRGGWRDVSPDFYSVLVLPGGMEVHERKPRPRRDGAADHQERPVVALGLTPVVMIRQSNHVDLEVRSPALPHSRVARTEASIWRFRAGSVQDAKALYEAVHCGRLNNAKYKALAEEARVRAFGQAQEQKGSRQNSQGDSNDGDSCRRRTWFGRQNSYRASTRAPSQSQHGGSNSSSTPSATSFLRRLMGRNESSFDIDRSTLNHTPQHPASHFPGSIYTSSASSGTPTAPHSIRSFRSLALSGSLPSKSVPLHDASGRILVRAHLNINRTQWLDKGACTLDILQPTPGVHQELALHAGVEKRIVVTRLGRKPLIFLDAVLGSMCFRMLGNKGIMCSIWEDLRDEQGRAGRVPAEGALSGRVTKWCLQFQTAEHASFVMSLVTTEVPQVLMG